MSLIAINSIASTSIENRNGIKWPPLLPGILINRYKRFLADVCLESGEIVTVHCPNSGAMTGCSQPGQKVFISFHDDPRRKLKYTWQLIEMPTSLIGVNTMIPNRLVAQSIRQGLIYELLGYHTILSEVKVGTNSRIDLLLQTIENRHCYVEIKNCTLVENEKAFFPDAVTSRGKKHLVELQGLVQQGYRCVMFYLIQRMDAQMFSPADKIDPDYGRELRKALSNGVEILVYDVRIDYEQIKIHRRVPCNF
jgi:sugar fermentation stimulation protein A